MQSYNKLKAYLIKTSCRGVILSECYDHQARDWGSKHHWVYTNESLSELNFITLLLRRV